MNKQQALQQYQEMLGERLTNETFPDEFLPERYGVIKSAAFESVSFAFIQQNFGIGWTEYKAIRQKTEGYSLYEINLINAVVLSRSPKELLQTDFAYESTMDAIEEMRHRYDAIILPIQQGIQKRIEIMSNHKGAYKETPLKFVN